MSLLTVVDSSRAGIDTTNGAAAAAGGDHFANTGKEVLVVSNTSGGPVNVTAETTTTVDGQAVADNVVAVADSKPTIIGPFPLSDYSDDVKLTYGSVTNVLVKVVRVTPGA